MSRLAANSQNHHMNPNDQQAIRDWICRSCPVRARCLDWALASGFDYGIWGGATEDERRAARVIALRLRSA
jgi:WhiB family transcriptional regulator, redox-sensing transcriptional regulator